MLNDDRDKVIDQFGVYTDVHVNCVVNESSDKLRDITAIGIMQSEARKPTTVPAGGSIVDQEIQRQRERETQLKVERELLSTASVLSPSSSPTVAPIAVSFSGRRSTEAVDAERLSKRRTFEGESSLVHEISEQRQREEELRQQRAASVNGHTDSGGAPAGHVDKQASGGARLRRTTKVRPFRDADNDDEDSGGGATNARLSFITPRNDTLIEREIRIARQREGSLRRVRGYPAVNQQTDVEVPLSSFGRRLRTAPPSSPATSPRAGRDDDPDGGGAAPEDDVAMRRLATNRLRLEILRERKREIDLRNQGKIYTISEEHIETPPLLAELVATSASTSSRSDASPRTTEQKNPAVAVNVVNSDGRHHWSAAAAQRQQQQQQQHDRQPQVDSGKRRLIGEKLIEQEVTELRRREQELRSASTLCSQSIITTSAKETMFSPAL